MILGAGRCQVPIIKQAQQMGFETIAVSIGGDYPGLSVADKSYEVDVREKEKILEIARQERICGILTDQTDIPVPSVAYVAEEMGLPGIGCDCALRFTNKYKMRQFCEEIGIPVPRYFLASSLSEAREQAQHLGFPFMVKPVDSQGSRGVTKVNHLDELEGKFQNAMSYSASGHAILERFLPWMEIVVQGFVSDYDYTNLIIGDRDYFDLPDMFIPKKTMFPSLLAEELKQKILELDSHLIKGFGPKFGITHNEYLVNDQTGEVCLGETAIRGGGVFISSDLVPLACGANVNKLLIEIASGKRKNSVIDKSRLCSRAAGYICFYLPEGVIYRAEGLDKINSLSGVHKAYFQDLNIGEPVRQIRDKSMRLGPILVSGKDRSACQETILRIQETLVVQVETSNGIKGIVW
jgi:carbamoyl-phosphate synthase large subunit